MESSRAHAILVGTNGTRPRLQFWPEGVPPREGERIVTSAEANAFPANLPIGTVHYTPTGAPEVEPAAMLQKLEVVRIFDYGLNGVTAPEAAHSTPDHTAPDAPASDPPTPGLPTPVPPTPVPPTPVSPTSRLPTPVSPTSRLTTPGLLTPGLPTPGRR